MLRQYAIWNVLWIGWNALLVCFYLSVGILDKVSVVGRRKSMNAKCDNSCLPPTEQPDAELWQRVVVRIERLRLSAGVCDEFHRRSAVVAHPAGAGGQLLGGLRERRDRTCRRAANASGESANRPESNDLAYHNIDVCVFKVLALLGSILIGKMFYDEDDRCEYYVMFMTFGSFIQSCKRK